MIAPEKIREIKRLLQSGTLSQRNIGRRLGVSRGIVNAVARGKRPDHAERERTRPAELLAPSGLPVRCPTCGGLVQMPCVLCRVRAIQRYERMKRRPAQAMAGGRVA